MGGGGLILKYISQTGNYFLQNYTMQISIYLLVSAAEQAGLTLIWSRTPEDRFSHVEAHL